MDIWYRSVGMCQTIKHQNTTDIPIKNFKNDHKRLHDDLKIPFISDVIHSQAIKYRNRNTKHTNELISALTDVPPTERRLKRQWPEDLLNNLR
jgi:hypothetical protein